ncbi:hypothetical protein [Paenibacillus sp. RC67]|uniref:hypothetical protein n=1 Tax=Paenibacillus sp. RC67 TaxID=3039392 RepID=UPI0024ACEC42|nr:hypothetical protein [Paenibacillus sp. RC67]
MKSRLVGNHPSAAFFCYGSLCSLIQHFENPSTVIPFDSGRFSPKWLLISGFFSADSIVIDFSKTTKV